MPNCADFEQAQKRNRWTKYFKPATKLEEFATHKKFQFLDKGEYNDITTMNNRYSPDGIIIDKEPFKLNFRGIRAYEKHLFLGDSSN